MKGAQKGKNKKEQHSNAAHQHEPHACLPAVDAEVLALKQALQSATKTNQKLASINTNLRKQVKEFSHKENSWVLEKSKLVKKNRIIRTILGRKHIHAQNEIIRLEGVLKAAETNRALVKEENENAAFENTVDEGEKWTPREEQIASQLKEMHERCQEQQVVIKRKEKLINRFQREMVALLKEYSHTEDEHPQSERQQKIKQEVQEVRLKDERRRHIRCLKNIYSCSSPSSFLFLKAQ